MALRPDQTPPPQTPKTPRQPGSWLRLALLAGLSLYIVILLSPFLSRLGGPARVDMSYSQLLTQVDSGNVADITIQGQSAQGDLKTSFTNNGVTNTQFSTTLPVDVGLTDPTFFPLLKNNHVATVVKPDTGGIGSLLLSFLPFLALIAIWIWFMRRSGQAAQGIFSFGRSRARMQEPGTPKTTFHDVAGVEQAQFELQEMVDFLRDPQKFQRLGGRMPKGVLLIGPPGTGKTLLARAIAGEAGVPFFSISASEFVEMFVGVGASRVRSLFEDAKKHSPSVIFVDELDAVGRQRGAGRGRRSGDHRPLDTGPGRCGPRQPRQRGGAARVAHQPDERRHGRLRRVLRPGGSRLGAQDLPQRGGTSRDRLPRVGPRAGRLVSAAVRPGPQDHDRAARHGAGRDPIHPNRRPAQPFRRVSRGAHRERARRTRRRTAWPGIDHHRSAERPGDGDGAGPPHGRQLGHEREDGPLLIRRFAASRVPRP